MSRAIRLTLFGVFVLLLLVGALSSFVVVRVRAPFPQTSGEVSVPGLRAPVEVVRDQAGVPHLYGDSVDDLYAAQGYVQAQDRFFEMDVRRHITAGRLSELFGASQLETDAVVRTLGWRQVAEQELSMLSTDGRRHLQAHAAGVNAYLSSRSSEELALEYSVLALTGPLPTPEPWQPVDSLAWLKAMSWQLSDGRTEELERARLTAVVGPERAAELYPEPDLETNRPVLTAETPVEAGLVPAASGLPAGADDALARAGAAVATLPAVLGGDSAAIGSNAWVLSGEHTDSGAPLLSNDPHLAISVPSVFSQVGLHCRTVDADCPLDVSGYSFAGVPGVVIGHNQSIAWGFTTPYVDTEDLVVERVRDGAVARGDDWQPLLTRTELIRVRGEEEPHLVRVRSSDLGPLLSDADPDLAEVGRVGSPPPAEGEELAVALQSTALRPGRSMDALLQLNTARDFEQFRSALSLLGAPSQNVLYADVEGNIGYQLPGAIPDRGGRPGHLPALGWEPGAAWRGPVPFEELPYSLNPADGVLVSANQAVVGTGRAEDLHTQPAQGWRSQQLRDRLTELGSGGRTVSTDEAEALFYDTRVRYADALVPALVEVAPLEPWVADGQRVLQQWDRRADADSAGAAWFHVVLREVLRLTFADELPPDLQPDAGGRWMAVLDELVADPDNPWWDDVRTPEVEQRDDVLAEANLAARKQITALISRDPAGWEWGKLHRLELQHQTLGSSGIEPVEALFNRDGPALDGTANVVDAMSWSPQRGDFVPVSGPTMRMLVDLGDLDASRWVNQTGVSGHAFAEHHVDQTELWARNDMMTFSHSSTAVHQAARQTLRLVPID